MKSPAAPQVLLSVVIPARDEAEYLPACLRALAAQTRPPAEVIVVDNGSSDNTAVLARRGGALCVSEPRIGLTRARQTGARHARGEWLVFVDADTVVPPDYLERIGEFIATHPDAAAVSNPYVYADAPPGLNLFARVFFAAFSVLEKLGIVRFIYGGNFAINKSKLIEAGGFNEEIEFYGEDTDLTKRISRRGRIYFLGDLYTKTSARRFKKMGCFRTIATYAANYLSVGLWDRPCAIILRRAYGLRKFAFITPGVVLLAIFSYGFFAPQAQVFGKTVTRLHTPPRAKVVALTFDDGPNGYYTEEVLNILKEENVKATFFLVGDNVVAYPEVARDIARNGQQIGNHSLGHSYLLPFRRTASLEAELARTNAVIYRTTGERPKVFRPPHGFKTPWLIKAARREGLTVVTWSVMTTDYSRHAKADVIAKQILKKVRPGAIIVLHDGLNRGHNVDRQETVKALRIIIRRLKAEGYTFTTLEPIAG